MKSWQGKENHADTNTPKKDHHHRNILVILSVKYLIQVITTEVERVSTFKATSKNKAGKQLGIIKAKIASESSKYNRTDLVPILLCLEDAVNNFEIVCIRHARTGEKHENHDEFILSTNQLITEWYKVINELLMLVVKNGEHLPPRITTFPQFSFGICIQQNVDDYLLELYKKGELDGNDLILKKPRLFLNRFPGWFFIAVRGSKDVEDIVYQILDMRDLFYKEGLLETMLYVAPEGTIVEFDDKTGLRKITLPDKVTVESVLEGKGVTPRKIETYANVFDWNSFFREIAIESLKSVEIGKGEKNLENLRREDKEIYSAYSQIKDYSKTFRKFYGIELEAFFNILSEITYLCYNNTHTVGYWKYSDLLKEPVLARFNSKDIVRTIQLLSQSPKSEKSYDGFVLLGDNVFTNFRRLIVSRIILLEKCFGEVYSSDLKGKAFENACRRMLNGGGLKTLPGRIDIFEPTVSDEIAFALWGRQKQRTDIDVVSSKNNSIIIIECKEIKSSLESRKQRQFEKYVTEHFHKVKWIRDNFERFESYVGADIAKLSIDKKQPVYFFPLVVTNLLVTVPGLVETPLITYLELKEIISSTGLQVESHDKETGVLECKIGARKIDLPWLSALIKAA
jgi:hypothetical protein